MKIHTTQNLNSLALKERSTNNANALPNEIRYDFLEKNSSDLMAISGSSVPSFKGKKPEPEVIKKIIQKVIKKVGDVAGKAAPEVKKGDKLLESPLFGKTLNVVDYETVAQATIAAVACVGRAGTLWGMSRNSSEENKGNNIYAICHALASGIVGFVTVFALTAPFKAGSDHVMKKMFKNLKEETLKRLHPHLDLSSIKNSAGERLEEEMWKDIYGNKFSKEIKNCDMLPKFKHIAEVSQETFEKILGLKDVDWKMFKDKSFNEVKTKSGQSIYELINFENLGIKVRHTQISSNGKGVFTEGQILLRDLDKNYLEELVSKADEGSMWKDLDVASVFDKNGKVVDFRKWKNKSNGEQWKLDLDSIFIASPYETCDYSPRITGGMRFDKLEGVYKFITYQRNGKEIENSIYNELGTAITDAMLKAENDSAGLIKSLTWLPDLIFRVPIAMTTVALIPWILKTVFHIEKQKKPEAESSSVAPAAVAAAAVAAGTVAAMSGAKSGSTIPAMPATVAPAKVSFNGKNDSIAFKGNNKPKSQQNEVSFKGNETKFAAWIGKAMGNLYGRPLIESDLMAKISAKLSGIPGGLTQAMATFGALLTSATYVTRTLKNKNLEDDKKRTLAVNQTLCWIVPTIAAYSVDKVINNWVKGREYRYSGKQQHLADKLKLEGKTKEAKELLDGLGKKVKGIRILASLSVFTIIYRYATPVLITPLANRIGNKINANRAAKQKEQEAKLATAKAA